MPTGMCARSRRRGWYPDDLVRVYSDMARELKLPATAAVGEGFPRVGEAVAGVS